MTTDLNDEEHDLRIMKNVKRRIELKAIRNTLTVRNELLRLKKKELKESREELDKINSESWNAQDRFYDEVWNFSTRHNFNKFFNQYPSADGTQIIEPHKCKYNSVIDDGAGKTDIWLKLEQEIDIINNELTLVRNDNVRDDLKRCQVTLDSLVSFSEQVLKLIRYIIMKLKSLLPTQQRRSISATSAADNSSSISNTNENERAHTNKGFTTARTLLSNRESGFRNCVSTEGNYVSTFTNITGKSERHFDIRNTVIKHRTFVMKKPSTVALKYEKKRY